MKILFSALFLFSVTVSVQAESLFDVTIVAEGQTVSQSFDSALDLINAFDGASLENTINGYNDNSIATGTLNFRGIPIVLTYPNTGATLRIQVAETGLDRTFNGATRDESEDLLEAFFKSEGDAEITKLLQTLAKKTANDPIAGNPNSLMATQVSSDFDTAFSEDEPRPARAGSTRSVKGASRNDLSIGTDYTRLRGDSFNSEKVTVPIAYTYRSKENSRRKYRFKLPLSRVEVAGSQAFHLGAGFAVSIPVSEKLTTTPSINYGLSGSDDFGSGAQMVSGSLSNSYNFEALGLQNTYGNLIGYYDTLTLKIGDFEIDPDLTLIPFVNGLRTTIPAGTWLKKTAVSLYVIDTHYFGDDILVDHMDEFGVGFTFFQRATLGFNYLYAKESKGFRFGFNFRF